ncbi:hypothetical protein K458DRAFT_405699 [Lentithecium fluviatile CBS 122367]|uniref:C2H2-type domain-containing protein n=1 Tax=Lentithecium fluviatile CBS 122367 TaxID=1168545 RepID=A0A6G1IWX1_9PLEO|nr:hypothetical protein K458DRAFT_405699 [Lentithecium fluviatile CBS 122367]
MMHTVDTHSQAFNSQRREQRHPEDGATTNFTSSSNDRFLFPSDAQGQFTYSAEPSSMLDYSSVSGANQQEGLFSPNNGSSFDSSLHPDAINPSYSSVGTYMQAQNYSLSPGTHSRNGQSISPSHSVDHLSPDTNYMSDPNYPLSTYTSPGYPPQYLQESFSQLGFSDHISPNEFPQYQGQADMSLLTPDALAVYNAQPPPQMLPSNARLADAQLLSPCPTNNSSPIVTDDSSRNASLVSLQHVGNEYQPSSTPPSRAPQPQQSTPSKQQQHSPALTNSPNNLALANPQPRASHLTSPIVRVEHYPGRDSPSPSDVSRPVSKRSHGSRRSGNHLSPYDDAEFSDDDDDADMRQPVRVQPVVRNTERNEDGSWLASPSSGQAGLSPEERQAMGDAWVPSIEEVVEQRLKEEKEREVQDWLSRSEVGSRAGDGGSSTGLLKPFTTRRRAKSTNDVNRRGMAFGLGVRTDFDRPDDSGIPGPGVYINEPSEFDDYEDDEDEDEDMPQEPESPPAEIEIGASQEDKDLSYFPPLENGGILGAVVRPWVDAPSQPSTTSTQYQPPTSNAAMMRFRIRAKEVDRASLAATVGSRRLSESDIGSIRAAPGVIKVIEPAPQKHKERQRRPSFLENILPKRAPSNLLKRKGSMPVQQPAETAVEKVREPSLEKPKRMGSWGRPKSPRLDTSFAHQGKDVGPPSSTGLSATSGTWYQGAKNAIRRSRSRSDLGKSPGLAQLMTQHGGPPMPMLASPLPDAETNKLSPQPSPGGDDDDDEQEAITMDLAVRSDPIIPTYEGFKTHARQLNPRLTDYMVERITQEQMRRYKRLLEFKVKHLNAVKNRSCSSIKFCPDLGGESQQLAPRAGKQDADAPFIGFQVTAPGSSDDDGDGLPEGNVAAASFPAGVPLPPVKRLPAEFECPLCFKVKKFYKPSDWTKHVHEDVQPFTCTFPNCGEPKSFKRKADWVRHENERHRQLEHWTCQISDCNHTCYRKDNFVQHLVREHKIAEPRQRTVKGVAKDPPAGAETDDIWGLVARCRRDTTKQPKDEPCRFCGNICTTWKKLTVHLAKHMEQISMPILPLVEQKQMNADTIISPVVEMPENRKLSATPNRSPVDNPSRYNPTSTLAPGIDPSFGQYPSAASAVASNVMHTYPPPQMVPYKTEGQVQNSNYANFAAENTQGYSGRTYPGLQDPTKTRGAYVNNLQIPNQQYLNGGMQNGVSRVPMTPASSIGQQSIFTDSPIDSGPYTNDTMASTYFTQEPQNVPANGMPNMGFDAGPTMQFPPTSPYQEMGYITAPQQTYHYQGQ